MSRKSLRRYSVVLTLLVGTASIYMESNGQIPGNCAPSVGEAYLDVANVRARILNNGHLFWRSDPSVYEVPKGDGVHAIFASSILLGGMVGDDLRVAASRYGPYEFWSGPISDDGSAPADCSIYDRVWKINRSDIVAFDLDGTLAPDLAEWPTGLGAPTLSPANPDGSLTVSDGVDNDFDGVVDEAGEMRSITNEILAQPLANRINRAIDLAAGERPDITGDQMIWWIMNDVGNEHQSAQTEPIGLEIHGAAFAFDQQGDIGNTTFYRFTLFYKGPDRLRNAYFGIFSDPDFGNPFDDLAGSDSLLGLAIVYNADNDDEGPFGYGLSPPALGYDFVRGPVVETHGDTVVVSSQVNSGFTNLQMTSFMTISGIPGPYGSPNTGSDFYNYMQAKWKNGTPLTEGDWGFTSGNPVVRFSFPGDAANKEFWSELNPDGRGTANRPGDRKWIAATGPFEVSSTFSQEITFAIVWARGYDHLDSYRKLKVADRRIQNFVDAGFIGPEIPDAPVVTVGSANERVVLSWTNSVDSNNYDDGYREFNPFGDPDYPYAELEGYEVWQFETADDEWPGCVRENRCHLVNVFDVENGVKLVTFDEDADDVMEAVAFGTDSGIRHSISIDGVSNYGSLYFGVRAYVYTGEASPPVIRSAFSRVEAVPTPNQDNVSEAALAAAATADSADIVAVGFGIGSGTASINIVDPMSVRACDYRIEFYEGVGGTLSHDVWCGEEKILDGSARSSHFGANLGVFDGLEYSLLDAPIGIRHFTAVANADGPLDPYDMAALAAGNTGYPEFGGLDQPTSGYQQARSDARWVISVGGGEFGASFDSFTSRVLRSDNLSRIGRYDYEMRFTAEGGKARREFEDAVIIDVPFELWRTGVNTPDDRSDDIRLVPFICEDGCGAGGTVSYQFDIGRDHTVSAGVDDPYSDWIYWNLPSDTSAGQSGYDQHFASEFGDGDTAELFARTVLVNLDGGTAPPYNAALPEEGTIFRITTNKPIQPGDSFTFSTHGYEPTERTTEEKVAALADVGIVPNPYYGASLYERTNQSDEVRFTALPQEATIRVFTLNGTLVRTLRKNSPEAWLPWDLKNEYGRPLASGLYLVHVDVPGVGSKVVKFSMAAKGR